MLDEIGKFINEVSDNFVSYIIFGVSGYMVLKGIPIPEIWGAVIILAAKYYYDRKVNGQ